MYIIQVFDKYYLKDDSTHVIETYSPIVATSFNTKKEAKEYVAKNTEWKDNAKILKRTPEMIDEFNAWLITMQRRRIEKIDRSGANDFSPTKHGRDDVFDFWMNNHYIKNMSYESYNTWPDLSEYFKNLYDVCEASKGKYFVECWFKKDDDYNTFEKEMTYLFDHVSVDELNISVFDHLLCEGGDKVDFTISRDLSKIKVNGRFISKTNYSTLKELFDFLVKERYYEI